jgi:integrase
VAYARKKTLSDGSVRWYAAYLGTDGRYHEEGGFRSEREAERAAGRLERDSERGDFALPAKGRMTFDRYVELHYWPTTALLEASTRASYRSYLDKHFSPRFGHVQMRRISASHVQAWVNDAAAGGELSARSITKYHAFLHKVFARAVIDRVVPVNPCAHSELPKVIAKPKRIVTPEEFDVILDALPVRYQTMVLLDIETGLRWGELIALRPVDIDFVGRNVIVRRVVVEVSKKNSPTGKRTFIKEYPKDDEQRIVQVEAETCTLIREHMLAYGVRDDELLFTSTARTIISRNNFRTKVWLPALATAKLKDTVTFHNLRAAHASWLLAGGADLQVVKERLGHSQITTTQQYLGVLPDAGDRALAAFRRTRNRNKQDGG